MERSICGAEIHLDRLPFSAALIETATQSGWDPVSIGAAGGEDYILLCTVGQDEYDRLAGAFSKRFGKPLSRIGCILPPDSGVQYYSAGLSVKNKFKEFEHFPS